MTSRWVVDIAPQRNVPVRWRAYSLDIKNEGIEIPEPYRELSTVSRGALRVVEAVWDEYGEAPHVTSMSPKRLSCPLSVT